MESASGFGMPEVMVITPGNFLDAQLAVLAVREQKVVVLQASRLEPDQAQRTIDFVAGGVTALDGHSERLDATTFLFAPALAQLSHL